MQVTIGDLQVGWRSGVVVGDLRIQDAQRGLDVYIPGISAYPKIWALSKGIISCGPMVIYQPEIRLRLHEAITGHSSSESSALPSSPLKTSRPRAAAWALQDIQCVIQGGRLRITDPNDQSLDISDVDLQWIVGPSPNKSELDVSVSIDPNHQPATLNVRAEMYWPDQARLSLDKTHMTAALHIDTLDLSHMKPLMTVLGLEEDLQGVVSVESDVALNWDRVWALSAKVDIEDFQVTSPALSGDVLASDTVGLHAELAYQDGELRFRQMSFDSDLVHVSGTGMVPVTALSQHDLLTLFHQGQFLGTFQGDLGKFFASFEHTLNIKEDLHVDRGTASGHVHMAGGQISASMAVERLHGRVDDKIVELFEPVQANLLIVDNNDAIHIETRLNSSFAHIQLSGDLNDFIYKQDLDLTLLRSEMGKFFQIEAYPMDGRVSIEGQARIRPDHVRTSGWIALERLQLYVKRTITEPRMDIRYQVGLDRSDYTTRIESLQVDTGFGVLTTQNAVIPRSFSPEHPLTLPLSVEHVNLAILQQIAVALGVLTEDMALSGTAQAQMRVTHEGQGWHLACLQGRVENLELVVPDRRPIRQSEVNFALDVHREEQGQIRVSDVTLDMNQIKIRDGRFQKVIQDDILALSGQAHCEYDWVSLRELLSDVLPPELTLLGRRSDMVVFSATCPQDETRSLLDHLNARAGIGFEQAGYMGLECGPTDVNISVVNGLLEVQPFTSIVNNGRFSFACQADLKQQPVYIELPEPMVIAEDIQITTALAHRLLQYVNPLFANLSRVSGVARFECERLRVPVQPGSRNNIEIIGTFAAHDLVLGGSDLLSHILSVIGERAGDQRLTIRPSRFVLSQGMITYDNMQVDVGDNPVNFSGSIGLDEQLDMTVTLPYTFTGRTARVDGTADNRIALHLTGTLSRPQLDMRRLRDDVLQQHGEELLNKGLEELFKRL
jgi:hypothetical protein